MVKYFVCPQVTEAQYGRALAEDARQYEEDEAARHQSNSRQKREYGEALDRQLLEQERKRMKACEEFLREKMAIDEIVRRIHEEDQM